MRKLFRFFVGAGEYYFSFCPNCGKKEYQCGTPGVLHKRKPKFYSHPCDECSEDE
jgi:hypothetical protein